MRILRENLYFLEMMSYSASYAQVAKLVDAPALGAGVERHGGSSPLLGTENEKTALRGFFIFRAQSN